MSTLTAYGHATGKPPPDMAAVHRVDVEHAIDLDHIYLRPIRLEDLEGYKQLLQDPVLMEHVGLNAGELPSDEECEALVAGAVRGWSTRGWGRWSIFDTYTDKLIGFCGFRSEDGVPDLISMVFQEYWGTGVARSAAEACINHGYRDLGFDRIVSFTRPDNGRARGLLKKLGAEFAGYVDFHGVTGAAYEIRSPA